MGCLPFCNGVLADRAKTDMISQVGQDMNKKESRRISGLGRCN